MSVMTTIGSRIEQSRAKLGLSLPQLARRIGVKRQTLENWENDRSEPRPERLLRIAGVLQVPMTWLLTGDTPSGSTHDPDAPETARIAKKLDRAIAMQQDLAALLLEVSADISRLQRELEESRDLAA